MDSPAAVSDAFEISETVSSLTFRFVFASRRFHNIKKSSWVCSSPWVYERRNSSHSRRPMKVYILRSTLLTKMEGVQNELEIKFRLTDGSDIGPKTYPVATSVATLKESVLTQWPKESRDGPRTVKDVKIISAGKILENHRTIGDCQSPLYDITGGATTMHVIVQPRLLSGKDRKAENSRNQCKCVCVIL